MDKLCNAALQYGNNARQMSNANAWGVTANRKSFIGQVTSRGAFLAPLQGISGELIVQPPKNATHFGHIALLDAIRTAHHRQ